MPRNLPAFERGQELHAYIRDLIRLTSCPCCKRPQYTADELRRYLPEQFKDRDTRTLRSHIARVLIELDKLDEE